ncbi:hypothetical protein [Mycolicibacterium vaccae]|jgi:hypothetical protein|uniref:Uncharacterized protein n=1 Tax=Mycolicibacterium vaccae ATCC 25954 TaxID=1194972 RepID=K0VB94_MYCVA|nr:hypothetical protein [Mycolicibacterium vaccae]ANI39402.1 hypothetical protein MYVA_2218 [Mycolicibacterium vaccae 95051]EJZ08329.1 hypothetical protein MVAC_15538 [Mycolicibacterium vaccae ATCC 25954]MCV7059329.1 hypothetical protein [Mycolicibacterium vaccae]
MSAAKGPKHKIEVNPLLSRLLSHGVEAGVLRGYVGPAKKPGTVRLYPTLGFLHLYYEIDEDDIVDTAPAPETVLPHGGTILWVRNDADVVIHGDTVLTVPVRTLKSRQHAVPVPPAESAGPDAGRAVNVVRGRLRMSFPASTTVAENCTVCASCAPCSSCGVCTTGGAR